jgi:hypothetical protein
MDELDKDLKKVIAVCRKQYNGSPVIYAIDVLESALAAMTKERDEARGKLEVIRETLRQMAAQPCDPTRHNDGSVCSPCHARSYFKNVETPKGADGDG